MTSPAKVLTPEHKDLLTFIEQFWYERRIYPTVKALEAYAEVNEISAKKLAELERDLLPYIEKRGIGKKSDPRLSELQLAAANLVLNFTDRRSATAKLKAIGVTPTQWNGWMRDVTFKNYVAERTAELLEVNTHEAHLGLLKAVERGDSGALRLYYEMTGRIKGDSQVENVNLLLARLIEAIQRHVQDPEILGRISQDFEAAMLASMTKPTPVGRLPVVEGELVPKTEKKNEELAIYDGMVAAVEEVELNKKKTDDNIFNL